LEVEAETEVAKAKSTNAKANSTPKRSKPGLKLKIFT
jgi:hypothetical protein